MARRIFFSLSLWQVLQSALVVFCLVSNQWIVSENEQENYGLFSRCYSANSSCNATSRCNSCNLTASNITCGDFHDDRQGLDREMVGGILATVLLARAITFTIFLICLIISWGVPREDKIKVPNRVILIEELAGICDLAVIAIYMAYNNVLLVENPCLEYGVAFWLNFVRPLAAFLYLRVMHPGLMSLILFLRLKCCKTDDDATAPLNADSKHGNTVEV